MARRRPDGHVRFDVGNVDRDAQVHRRALYSRLEAETGQSTGFKPVGFIELATEPDRLEEYRRVSTFNRYCGVDVHEISAKEVAELFPLARTDDVLAGFYVKEDGRANPVDVTMALAKGARQKGATIIEGVAVTDVLRRDGAVTGVRTDHGEIEAEYVVNCAGMWARQLGEVAGVNISLQAAEHYYLITEQIDGLSNDWPVIEDPANFGYYREEVGGLMIGLFESVCAPWNVGSIPDDFSFGVIQPDWDRMGPYVERAMSRVPISMETGIRTFFCGPESFTPDLQPVVGEAPELKNYFVAAGMNSIGILTGGGMGRVLAHWILTGQPDVDVTGFNIDRLHRYQSNPEYRATRTVESLGMVYQCHYPGSRCTRRGRPRCRRSISDCSCSAPTSKTSAGGKVRIGSRPRVSNRRRAPVVGSTELVRLLASRARGGAQRRDRDGHVVHVEVPRAGPRRRPAAQPAVGQQRRRRSGRDHVHAVVERAGTIEADLTVTKLDDDRFWVVATDTAHRHVETRMRRHFGDHHAIVTDVTAGHAQLNVQGPRSRELLQSITSADLSNEAFPFRTARHIDIGFARVLCVRITYLGELGYELYVSAEQAVHVYDRIVVCRRGVGLRHAGLKALGSLRMEKGYRDYGHDIDNTDSVLEAGLGFAVDLDKADGFIGRDAVVAKKAAGR